MTPGAAGTAADHYRATPPAHPHDPLPADYGARDLCRRCGAGRDGHQPLRDTLRRIATCRRCGESSAAGCEDWDCHEGWSA